MFKALWLKFSLSRRFLGKGSSGRFAPAVAIISTLGITIGIAALIVVSSIMSGLEGRLKEVVLSATPQLMIKADLSIAKDLAQFDNLEALCPMVEARALAQSKSSLATIILEGLDLEKAIYFKENVHPIPQVAPKGSYELALNIRLLDNLKLNFDDKVRIISTVNARYTMMGLTPSTRLFTIRDYIRQASSSNENRARGNYEDVKRVLRAKDEQLWLRLFLTDPYNLSEITDYLDKHQIRYRTWQESEGEFFNAVAMEKLAMSVMLFLIVMVAAFNLLSSLTMMVSSRLEEIAILKTLGMKNSDVVSIFFIMGLICSVTGIIAGTLIGIVLSLWANELLNLLGINVAGSVQIPVVIDYVNVFYIGISTLILSMICTAVPAIRAGSVDAAQTLEH